MPLTASGANRALHCTAVFDCNADADCVHDTNRGPRYDFLPAAAVAAVGVVVICVVYRWPPQI
jgi:hypothetical protein